MILSDILILHVSQLQTQKVIEYLIQTYHILVLFFVVKNDENSSLNVGF